MSTLTPEPTVANPNPTSPKVVAAAIWALVAPILIAAVLAGLGYLLTDDGRNLLSGLPVLLQVIIMAAVSSLAGALAAYKTRDPLRTLGTQKLLEDNSEAERVARAQARRDDSDPLG